MTAALLLALVTSLASGLEYGPYRVGYERIDGASGVSVWYPAERTANGTPMTLRAYGGELPPGLPEDIVTRYLDSPTRAVRDAKRTAARFPLVLIAHGNAQDAADQAVLAELIASHGFVVAATPSPMLRSPMTSIDEMASFAEQQADDLAAAIEQAGIADTRRIVVIGHSFGARSALLLAMRDQRISGIVSIDGGIGTATGADQMRTARSFDATRTPPILHFYGDIDPFMKADFAFLDSLGSPAVEKVLMPGMRHAHFTSVGFGSAAIPPFGAITKADPHLRQKLVTVANRTLAFVKSHTGR